MISSHVLPPESLVAPRNPWDMAIEGLLAALLFFMPLAFGAVEPWSELVVVAVAASLVLCLTLRAVVDRTFRPPWSWAYVPLGLFLLLIAIQLLPLPRGLVGLLSPATLAVRSDLLGSADQTTASTTISLYPLATVHGLRMALAAAAIFVTVAATARTTRQVKRLLWIIFGIGCAEAALALLQIFTRASDIYWSVDIGPNRPNSGSFINYSNFCQFMNLSIGAGLALLLVRLQEDRRKGQGRRLTSRHFGGEAIQKHGGLLLALIVCALSIFTSLSRNGAISLLVAAAIVGTASFARGTLGWRGWIVALAPLGAAAMLLLFAFDAVYERMATLQSSNALAGRWEMTLATLRAWSAFPVFGVGLGAHEFVFPMFDTSVSRVLAEHADNDYAQLLEETGVVGALLVATFAFVIVRILYKLCRRGRTSLSAAAFGLAFGLLAVAIHSGTDFGQHVPAVFGLSAVTCGLVVQVARIERESKTPSVQRPLTGRHLMLSRGAAVAALVAAACVAAWELKTAYSTFLGDQWWAMAFQIEDRIGRAAGKAPDEDYVDLIAASQQASQIDPGNVTYGYWLNARRWQAMSRGMDPRSGQNDLEPEAMPIVARIADELADVRRLCPTYGPPYALEGQLRLLVIGDRRGGKLIEHGVRLSPYDPPTCLIAGEIAAREGRQNDAAVLLAAR